MQAGAGPSASKNDGWDTWGGNLADWSQNAWAVQAQDTWSLTEQVAPEKVMGVFVDRWASAAVDSLIPFWARGVEVAERGGEPRPFAELLDELERSGSGIWKGLPDVRDGWNLPPQTEAQSNDSAHNWGSGLRSRPRTESLTGNDRPKTKAQTMAILENKGIGWPDDGPSNSATPNLRNIVKGKSKKSNKHYRTPVFKPEEHQEWVEDMIVKLRVNTKLAEKLCAFWLLPTDEKVRRITHSVCILSEQHAMLFRPPKTHFRRNRRR